MANYLDLYKWEKGYEPDWVFEARRDQIALNKACRAKKRDRSKAEALRIAEEFKQAGRALDYDAQAEIMGACKIGPVVLRRILTEAGYQVDGVLKGYPVSWPWFVRDQVASFVRGSIKAGAYGDEWLAVEDCMIACMRKYRDTEEYLTARGVRMALEAEGYTTVRRADGRGIVGYVLAL